jgi:AcrR family transcriptional regulator/DNA-binding MarR family transcriptional regulator
MLTAMCEVACERGAANVTVAHVVARSGVSRRTFYEIFEDRDDCYLAAFDTAVARASMPVLEAYDDDGKWVERIRASLLALLRFIDDEPLLGKLLIVDSLAAGPVLLERRSQILVHITAAVNEGSGEGKLSSDSPPLTAEGVVGAVFSVLHGRLLENERARFTDLLNPLMAMIVLPYLGAAASRRELDRPSAPKRPVKQMQPDPLASLDMRLTYRTMRVLLAIGSRPGSSNRQIADIAGVTDPGQMSKLLTRLHNLSLIENGGTGQARGEPNAWRLTKKGGEIEHAITTQNTYD